MNTRPWLITAPSVGLIFLFVAWSGYWYFLLGTAKSEIEAAFRTMKKSGLTINCSEKTYGGYPFRIRFDCHNPEISIEKGNTRAKFKADHLSVTAQAYKLGHLIAEIEGDVDFNITQKSDVSTIRATLTKGKLKGQSLRASAVFTDLRTTTPGPDSLSAFSLVSHQTHADIIRTTAWGENIPLNFKAKKTGLHLRAPRAPGLQGTDTDLAIDALNLKLEGNFYTPLEGNQFTAQRMVLNGLLRPFYPALSGPSSFAKNWHKLGGAAEIDALLIERSDFTLRAEGIVSLDTSGQMSGSMDAKFLGLENIFKTLVAKKVLSNNQAVLAHTGLNLLSKSTPQEQEQKIITVPINLRNGQLYFGPHSLGFSPSFF